MEGQTLVSTETSPTDDHNTNNYHEESTAANSITEPLTLQHEEPVHNPLPTLYLATDKSEYQNHEHDVQTEDTAVIATSVALLVEEQAKQVAMLLALSGSAPPVADSDTTPVHSVAEDSLEQQGSNHQHEHPHQQQQQQLTSMTNSTNTTEEEEFEEESQLDSGYSTPSSTLSQNLVFSTSNSPSKQTKQQQHQRLQLPSLLPASPQGEEPIADYVLSDEENFLSMDEVDDLVEDDDEEEDDEEHEMQQQVLAVEEGGRIKSSSEDDAAGEVSTTTSVAIKERQDFREEQDVGNDQAEGDEEQYGDDEGDDSDDDEEEEDGEVIDGALDEGQVPPTATAPSMESTTTKPQSKKKETLVSSTASGTDEKNKEKQSQQAPAALLDDKPWRRRRSRRPSTGSLSSFLPSYPAPTPTTTNQQQSQQQSILFRYIRNWGSRTSTDSQPENLIVVRGDESSDDDAVGELEGDEEDDDDAWDEWAEDGESCIDPDDGNFKWQGDIEWTKMPLLPNAFFAPTAISASLAPTSHHPHHVPHYLDPSMLQGEPLTRKEADRFAWEQAMLLQAILQLLAERDQVGVEGSMDLADNIWKKGPLKKLSFAVGRFKKRPTGVAGSWKVKYVELRQGNLCYYEDSGPSSGRKTIHLRQADTIVQESSFRGPGFVFELLVQGSPARFWTASSEEERQSWIRAIQAAMIGQDAAPRRELDLTPHQESLHVYTKLRDALRTADLKAVYLGAIKSAIKEIESLQIPVQWVREQGSNPPISGPTEIQKTSRSNPSPRKRIKNSVDEFWRSMRQINFEMNGSGIPKDSPFASQRVIGALTRSILEFDKACLGARGEEDQKAIQISELQAVSYTRNILLAVLRSQEQQDTGLCVRHLLEAPGLVVVAESPSENEGRHGVVQMEVSFPGEEIPDDFLPDNAEMTAWLWSTRRKNSSIPLASSKFKRRYTVLSGGVLSYYDASEPRPHGLRGQLVLQAGQTVREIAVDHHPYQFHSHDGASGSAKGDGTVSNVHVHQDKGRYVLAITTSAHERLLCFKEHADLELWKEAIQAVIDASSPLNAASGHQLSQKEQGEDERTDAFPPNLSSPTAASSLMTTPAKMFVQGANRVIKGAADGSIRSSIRAFRGAKDSGIKAIRIAKDGGIKALRGAVERLRYPSGGLTSNRAASTGSAATPASNSVGSGTAEGSRMARRPSMQMLLNSANLTSSKREPTVQCVVQSTQTFFVMASPEIDPPEWPSSGDPNSATDGSAAVAFSTPPPATTRWLSVQARLFQAFLMSGGPSGRIARGDAVVELNFVEETAMDEEDDDELDTSEMFQI